MERAQYSGSANPVSDYEEAFNGPAVRKIREDSLAGIYEMRRQINIPVWAELVSTRCLGQNHYSVVISVQCNVGMPFDLVAVVKSEAPLTRQEMFDTVLTQLAG